MGPDWTMNRTKWEQARDLDKFHSGRARDENSLKAMARDEERSWLRDALHQKAREGFKKFINLFSQERRMNTMNDSLLHLLYHSLTLSSLKNRKMLPANLFWTQHNKCGSWNASIWSKNFTNRKESENKNRKQSAFPLLMARSWLSRGRAKN